MDVSENSGVSPKSSIFIGFSIIFTTHFGVPLFLDCTISNHHFCHHHLGEYVWNIFPASSQIFQILLSHSKLFLSPRIVSGTIGSILGYDTWIHHLPNKTIKKTYGINVWYTVPRFTWCLWSINIGFDCTKVPWILWKKNLEVHPLIFQTYLLRRCFRYAFGSLGSHKIHFFQAVWKLEPLSIELLKVCGAADWTIHSIRYGKLQIWKAYRWLVGLLVVGISVGSPIDIQTRWVRYEWTRPSEAKGF